jgi:HEAT repeat protein
MEFEEYLRELADGATKLKVSALMRLSGLTPEDAAMLATVWSRIDSRRRRGVVRELIDLQEDNVELNFDAVFLCGLRDDAAEVRLQSIRGLWEYEGSDLIAPLVRLMERDGNAGVRAEAALALGRFVLLFQEDRLRERYFREAESGLRRVIGKTDEVEEVRARAVEAIGAYNDAWVRQAISEAYENGARRLKVSAVHAMGRSCEPRWLPLLVRELNNEEAEIRYEAAVACGSLGDEGAVPHLVKLVSDPDDEVRQASVASLGEIGGREARDALSELKEDAALAVREAAREALAEIDFEENPISFRPLA